MKLLILGATGPTGRQLVKQALDSGHSVAAFRCLFSVVRSSKNEERRTNALGTSKSFKGGIMTRATSVLLPSLEQAGVKRLILMSAFGVGDSFQDASAIQKFFFRTLLRSIYADKAKADALIQASALEWTIVRPVALTNGPRTGKYRVGERLPVRGFPKVSRADVADFMFRELTERAWVRKIVVMSS